MAERRKATVNPKLSEAETETETESEAPNNAGRGSRSPVVKRAPSLKNEPVKPDPGTMFQPNTDTKTRVIWTLIMCFGFLLILALGHSYVVLFVVLLNLLIFKEILQLKRRREKEKTIPYFHFLNWYFFLVTWYFLLIRQLGSRLQVLSLSYPWIELLTNQHALKSFGLYMIGFMLFVTSLEKGVYRYQFGQFAWSHMTLLFISFQSSVMVLNIYDGIIFFFLGAGLVVWNDVFAFIFGRWLGKTPLIKISPKKTWEGFIGAFVTTVLFSTVFSYIIAIFPQLVCPQENLTLSPFTMPYCNPGYPFQPVAYSLPKWAGGATFNLKPIVLHATAIATFASLIAPFGGFFASGFKRAFKIKDFGDLLPGHGGITDRMDCQIIMSLFVFLYRVSFLKINAISISTILAQVASMTADDQLLLHQKLTEVLTERGTI